MAQPSVPFVVLSGHRDSVLALSLWKGLLASASEDRTVRIWDQSRTARSAVRCLAGFPGPVSGVAFHPTQPRLFTASGATIFEFDMRRSEIVLTQSETQWNIHSDEVNCLTLNQKGYLASCEDSGYIKVIDTSTKRVIKTLRNVHDNICYTVCFRNPKSSELLSGGLDGKLVHWDCTKGKVLATYEFQSTAESSTQIVNPAYVYSISTFRSSGRCAAVALGDSRIAMVDLFDQRVMGYLEGGHQSAVSQVAFMGDNVLVSGGEDRAILLWNTASMADAPVKDTLQRVVVETRIAHGYKINALCVASKLSTSSEVFVADTSNEITIYSVQLGS